MSCVRGGPRHSGGPRSPRKGVPGPRRARCARNIDRDTVRKGRKSAAARAAQKAAHPAPPPRGRGYRIVKQKGWVKKTPPPVVKQGRVRLATGHALIDHRPAGNATSGSGTRHALMPTSTFLSDGPPRSPSGRPAPLPRYCRHRSTFSVGERARQRDREGAPMHGLEADRGVRYFLSPAREPGLLTSTR